MESEPRVCNRRRRPSSSSYGFLLFSLVSKKDSDSSELFLIQFVPFFSANGGKRDQREIERPSDNDERPSARGH